MQRYRYVGPPGVAGRPHRPPATEVSSRPDVAELLLAADPADRRAGTVTFTYVVDAGGGLRLADRRSEHVACAGGRAVLAAGEITFDLSA